MESEPVVWRVLEPGLVLALVMVLRAGEGIMHRVNAECRARSGTRKSRSGQARARCRARTGCTVKARAKVVPVRELKTAFRGIPNNLCHLRLVRAQGSDPKNVRSAPAQHFGFLHLAHAQGSDPKKVRSEPQGQGESRSSERTHLRGLFWVITFTTQAAGKVWRSMLILEASSYMSLRFMVSLVLTKEGKPWTK